MQVGIVTVDGREIGVVTWAEGDPDTLTPSLSSEAELSRRAGDYGTGGQVIPRAGGHQQYKGPGHREGSRPRTGDSSYGYGADIGGKNRPRAAEPGNVPYSTRGNPFDRERFRQELAEKPWLREKIKHISLGENQDPNANLAVIETMMNRAVVRGTSLEAQARRHRSSGVDEGGYYAGYAQSYSADKGSLAEGNINRALSGSNISRYATDNSSGDLARREIASGSFRHHGTINGESFFSPGHAEPAFRDRWDRLNRQATEHEAGQGAKAATESTLKGVPEDL